MTNGDLFFVVFLGIIAATRFLVFIRRGRGPMFMGVRVRHYMEGIVLLIISFVLHDLTLFAMGSGLFIDELPLILAKGPGHQEAQWNYGADYNESWCSTAVFGLIFIVYLLRNIIAMWI